MRLCYGWKGRGSEQIKFVEKQKHATESFDNILRQQKNNWKNISKPGSFPLTLQGDADQAPLSLVLADRARPDLARGVGRASFQTNPSTGSSCLVLLGSGEDWGLLPDQSFHWSFQPGPCGVG